MPFLKFLFGMTHLEILTLLFVGTAIKTANSDRIGPPSCPRSRSTSGTLCGVGIVAAGTPAIKAADLRRLATDPEAAKIVL